VGEHTGGHEEPYRVVAHEARQSQEVVQQRGECDGVLVPNGGLEVRRDALSGAGELVKVRW